MTRSHRPSAVTPSPGLPALTRPRPEIADRLKGRIELGREILNRANTFVGSETLKGDLTRWRDYNFDLLRQLFTSESLYKEYRSTCFPSRMAYGDEDAFRLEMETLSGQVSKLESIMDRLELYPESMSDGV